MHRYWKSVVEPLLSATGAQTIVEVGIAQGKLTARLLEWAEDNDATVHAIDPEPELDDTPWVKNQRLNLHRAKSLNILGRLEAVDVVLIDGDHNWYTVKHELLLLEQRAKQEKRLPPVIALHDVDWPYGRRDLYYDPESIPPAHRQPYAKRGIQPDSGELSDQGLNDHLQNAIYEHGVANGVRTAIEDFVRESSLTWKFAQLHGIHGLGLLATKDALAAHDDLAKFLEHIGSAEFLESHTEAIERARIDAELRTTRAKRHLDAALDEAERLHSAHDAELATRSRVEEDLAAARRKLEEASRVHGELTKQVAEAEQRLQSARREDSEAAAQLREELRQAHDNERQAYQQLAEARERAGRSDEVARALRVQAEEAEQGAQALRERVEEIRLQLERAQALEESARRELEHSQASINAVKRELIEAKREGALAKKTLARTERKSQRTSRRIRSARAQANLAEDRVRELTAQLKSELKANRDLQERSAEIAGDLASTQMEASTLRVALERTEHERDTLSEERTQLRQELERLRTQDKAANSEVVKLQTTLRDVRRKELSDSTTRTELLDALARQVQRAHESRSFRWGHRFFRTLAFLTFRRPKGKQTALDIAADLTTELQQSEERAHALPEVLEAGSEEAPSNGRHENAGRSSSSADAAASQEEAMRLGFAERYRALWSSNGERAPTEEELSRPMLQDLRAILRASARDTEPEEPGVDVIVCVHNAHDDVVTCLWSLLEKSTRPFHLILVDDGSDEQTASLLAEFAHREPSVELIRNDGPDHGYCRAANMGLRASTGAYGVLLNSDTIVTPGWLERIVECGESDPRIGILGPLSNAATHQSVPDVKEDGSWAVNELPNWLTPDAMAMLVESLSGQTRPRVPFINGFCYVITRSVLDQVGLFDEERFGSGYCEENDLSIRAQDAGFSLAVVDDAYVFHAKSRSYTAEGRKRIANHNYEVFLGKHGEERVKALLSGMEDVPPLEALRDASRAATMNEEATIEAFRSANPEPLKILFVLHGMPEMSGGGVHSIYQEVSGMRRLGIPARIAIRDKAMTRARDAYDDADTLFVPYANEDDLADHAETAQVVVATHFTTVAMVDRLRRNHKGFLPAYYVQDYEPFFVEPNSPQYAEALASYTAIPGQLLFAKTHWLCNLVGRLHGVHVAKVEPSLDTDLFSIDGRVDRKNGPVRITAMIRPRTPRRQPILTLDALSHIRAEYGDGVNITTFGCHADEVEELGCAHPGRHLGLLARQDVASILRQSDIFLDASTYQAFGRTALEAMASGCAAIVPKVGGPVEFAHRHEAVLVVDTMHTARVVDALTTVITNSDLRSALIRSGLTCANTVSTLKASLSEYLLTANQYHAALATRLS